MVTASEYAKLRGRSKGWVSGRIKAGLPATGSGRPGSEYQIDPAVAIEWEIEQARYERPEKGGTQRDRLAKEQADKVALGNAVEREQHMLRAQVEPVLMEMAADLSARLDATASRLANDLAAISDPADIRQRLLRELRGVRAGVADHLGQLARRQPDAAAGGGGADAAAAAKPKRVGGRKPRTPARKPRARKVA